MAAADGAGAAAIAVTARPEGSAAGRDEVAGALPNAGTGASEREKTSLSTKRSSIAGSGDVAGADSIGRRATSTSTRGSDTASLDSERDGRPDDAVKSDEYTTRRLDTIALDAGSPVAHSEGAHRPVAAPGGVDMAHRIASLLQLQANAAARPMSHVVLRLDAADGGPELIRIGIRDRAVDAMLALRDPVAAGHLEAQIGDLQQALGRHGLTGDALKVELLGPRTLEAVWFGAQASIPAGTSVMTEQRGGGQEPPTSHTPPRWSRGGDDGQGSSRRRHDSSNREM